MTFSQEYAAMRPLDGPPLRAVDWGFTGRKASQKADRISFFLRQIEVQGKIVEEERHWAMLRARKRSGLDPQQKIAVQERSPPEPKLPQLDPIEAFLQTLIFFTPSCVICDQPAICRTSERWVCSSHLGEFEVR